MPRPVLRDAGKRTCRLAGLTMLLVALVLGGVVPIERAQAEGVATTTYGGIDVYYQDPPPDWSVLYTVFSKRLVPFDEAGMTVASKMITAEITNDVGRDMTIRYSYRELGTIDFSEQTNTGVVTTTQLREYIKQDNELFKYDDYTETNIYVGGYQGVEISYSSFLPTSISSEDDPYADL